MDASLYLDPDVGIETSVIEESDVGVEQLDVMQPDVFFVKGRQRKSLNLRTKLDILDKLDAGHSCSDVGRQLNIAPSTIRSIRSNKEKIRRSERTLHSDLMHNVSRPREYIMEVMEGKLYDWIMAQGDEDGSLTNKRIRIKAAEIYEQIKAEQGLAGKFGASNGWFDNFKKRFKYKLKDSRDGTYDQTMEMDDSDLFRTIAQLTGNCSTDKTSIVGYENSNLRFKLGSGSEDLRIEDEKGIKQEDIPIEDDYEIKEEDGHVEAHMNVESYDLPNIQSKLGRCFKLAEDLKKAVVDVEKEDDFSATFCATLDGLMSYYKNKYNHFNTT